MNPAIARLASGLGSALQIDPQTVRPFIYGVFFDDVAAISGSTPGQATQTIQVQGQDFWTLQRMFSCLVGSTLTQRPNVLVQLTDTGTGENAFSQFVPVWSVFGDAYQPYVLSTPRWYSRNTSLSISVQNFESSTIDLRLSLDGVRVFG
ncbi:MAG TPA: hypothetical protein VEC14_01060 [Reyranellaceae bacterium]|nr:hypothetical protein [Reyranellaceae bacterium]